MQFPEEGSTMSSCSAQDAWTLPSGTDHPTTRVAAAEESSDLDGGSMYSRQSSALELGFLGRGSQQSGLYRQTTAPAVLSSSNLQGSLADHLSVLRETGLRVRVKNTFMDFEEQNDDGGPPHPRSHRRASSANASMRH